jgi:large subunit ribosomal protein L32
MVIRMRHTRSHTANRRSHHALKSPEMAVCKNCGGHHRPHHMCLNCGYYNGRVVIDLAAKAKDRADRMAAKREAIGAQSMSEPETPVTETTK